MTGPRAGRHLRPAPVGAPLLAALLALLGAACVSEEIGPAKPDWEFDGDAPGVFMGPGSEATAEAEAATPAVTLADLLTTPIEDGESLLGLLEPATQDDLGELDFLQTAAPSPFHRLGRNVVRGIDGSWSKVYTLRAASGAKVVKLLQTSVPDFPLAEGEIGGLSEDPRYAIRYVLHPEFYRDDTEGFGIRTAVSGGKVGDVLVVTAPPDTLLFIDELLHRVLADVPQIEIEVRVVEINLDDLLDWDVRMLATRLEDPGAPFDATTNPPSGNFGAGLPIQEGSDPTGAGLGFGSFPQPTDVTGFLLSLQGVHNDLRVDTLLSFLQTIGASQLISSPTVTVLNGHRARLNTGDRVPVFQASGLGTNAQVTTVFQDTGVTVELVPFIVGEDVIRIDVSVDVSAVTGEEPFVVAGVEVTSPIISQREAGTTVHVHSGQVFSLGGLRQSRDIETVTKVPLLGDIPVIGWLFKSRSSRKANTEIVFFITPRIKIPSETLLEPLDS